MRKYIKWLWLLIPAALVAVAVGAALSAPANTDIIQPGIAYLESLEKKDPNEVNRTIREREQAELDAQREEIIRQVRDGELDPFSLFRDAVIMGDSRAQNFWYYGFVDRSRTITSVGAMILEIHNRLDELAAMDPQYVYLCYGLNDVENNYFGSMEKFVAKYMEYIGQIRQRLPDTVVVVSSIPPYYEQEKDGKDSTEPTVDAERAAALERLRNISRWNEALQEACEENDVIYVDNAEICRTYADLWEPDGVHMTKAFYPHWGKNLVLAALEEGRTQVEDENS